MTRRDDIVAALKRATQTLGGTLQSLVACHTLPQAQQMSADAALLRALADALREGQERGPAQFNPWGGEVSCVWIIPEPKVKP